MYPATYNPQFIQGDTWSLQVSLSSYVSDPASAAAYDLTGHTAKSQLRRKPEASATVFEFDCDIPTPSAGVINLTGAASATELIPAGSFYWDLQIESSSTRYTVLRGAATVTAGVTR